MDSQAAAAVKLIVGNKCDLEESRVCACLWCINWREDDGELHLSSERCVIVVGEGESQIG